MICHVCEMFNHDGIVPDKKFIERIRECGGNVTYSTAGMIVLPPR
jgi:hypothetical protein